MIDINNAVEKKQQKQRCNNKLKLNLTEISRICDSNIFQIDPLYKTIHPDEYGELHFWVMAKIYLTINYFVLLVPKNYTYVGA